MQHFKTQSRQGLGVVVRNSYGRVIAGLSERITLPPTVEDLKALDSKNIVSFAIDLDLWDVVFEGDSEVIFKHLSSDQPIMAVFGHIVEDARSLAAMLRRFSYSHLKHKGNMVADKLTKQAKFLYEPKIWPDDIHSDAAIFVIFDKFFVLVMNFPDWFLKKKKKKKKKRFSKIWIYFSSLFQVYYQAHKHRLSLFLLNPFIYKSVYRQFILPKLGSFIK